MYYENMSKNTVILLSKAKQSLNFKLYSKLCLFDYKKLYIKKLFKFFFELGKILYLKKLFIYILNLNWRDFK